MARAAPDDVAPSLRFLAREDPNPALDRPGFWIRQDPDPDHRLLTARQLARVNHRILRTEPQRVDVLGIPSELPGVAIRGWVEAEPLPPAGPRYHADGRRVSAADYARLRARMNLSALRGSRPVRLGLTVAEADVRGAPSASPMLWAPDRAGFDALQWSLLGPGEPVALLHTSADDRWGFVQTPFYRGWVVLDRLGFGDDEVVSAFARPRAFVVVTGTGIRLGGRRMHPGTVLPLLDEGAREFHLQLPARGPGGGLRLRVLRVGRSPDLHKGYLPLTRRLILGQAFRFLGLGYRWGGLDCSQFVQWVFRPFGLQLPRNSAQQANAGKRVAILPGARPRGDRVRALRRARPGTTLLYLPGHIMLFLGEVGGRAYAIHAIHRYHDLAASGRERSVYLDRVLVTDLDRGARHPGGSLLDRITVISDVVG